jgi:hypothetical protein
VIGTPLSRNAGPAIGVTKAGDDVHAAVLAEHGPAALGQRRGEASAPRDSWYQRDAKAVRTSLVQPGAHSSVLHSPSSQAKCPQSTPAHASFER